ncbi:MAG: hypothetical protein RL701_4709 [Pseudomonadota bacterium]|jgi:hypothetical protein
MQHSSAIGDRVLERAHDERIDSVHNIPVIAMHLIPLLAFMTGITRFDTVLCLGLYVARTAANHGAVS